MSNRRRIIPEAPRVGILLGSLEDDFQLQIARGISQAALGLEASLRFFVGGVIDPTHKQTRQRNRVYELPSGANVDGLILIAGSLGYKVTRPELAAFCDGFAPLPICCVAGEVPDHSAVLVDNHAGMFQLIDHLVTEHGKRRLAFVKGPELNDDAELRFRAYCDVLAKHGIDFDANLVAPGEFSREDGRAAVRLFLDKRKLSPGALEAIIAVDDLTALGVLAELQQRGVRVPGQIVVTGFDDFEETQYTSPPLSTVAQPLLEVGRAALTHVVASIRQQSCEPRKVLAANALIRRSCGCSLQTERQMTEVDEVATRLGFNAAFISQRAVIQADLARAAQGGFRAAGTDWEGSLLRACAAQVQGDTNQPLLRAFDQILATALEHEGHVRLAHQVVSVLRRHVLACVEPERRTFVEEMMQEMRLLVAAVSERTQVYARLAFEEAADRFRLACGQIATCLKAEELQEILGRCLPPLGFEACYVAHYVSAAGPAGDSRLLAYFDAKSTRGDGVGTRFKSSELVPTALLRPEQQRKLIVEPLFSGERALGFVVFECKAGSLHLCDTLKDLIRAALNVILLGQMAREPA